MYPESGIKHKIIHRIQRTISRDRREDFSIIKKMKTMIVRKTQTAETDITSDEVRYIWSEELEEIRMISLNDEIICHSNISE